MYSENSEAKVKSSYRILIRFILFTILLLLFVGAYKVYHAVTIARKIYEQTEQLRQEADSLLQADDLSNSIRDLRSELAIFHTDWNTLQDMIWPLDEMAQWLTWIPEYGDDLAVGLKLVEVVDISLESINLLEELFDPLLSIPPAELITSDSLLNAATIVTESQDTIVDIQIFFAQIESILTTIDINNSSLHPLLEQAVTQASIATPILDLLIAGLQALPDGLGIEKPHHILVLIQNADEIRPTGGFITAVAYVTVDKASIQEITFLQSSDPSIDRYDRYYQYETPPDPFVKYMDSHLWIFRDANWSPDFPTSASKAAELFTLGTQDPVDTVIAINQFTIQSLLRATGSINLRDGTVVNDQNFIAVSKDSWSTITSRLGRKQITEELGILIIERLVSTSNPTQLLSLFNAFVVISEEKNLYAYSGEQDVQNLFQNIRIDGSIPISKGDYLHIVDFNVGYDKVGVNIQKDFDYAVNLQKLKRPYAILNTRHRNLAPASPQICPKKAAGETDYDSRIIDCYGNYLRVYLPNNSEVHHSPQFDIPSSYDMVNAPIAGLMSQIPDERGKEILAGLQIVPPGQTVSGTFIYGLDPTEILSIQSENSLQYSLLLQKQSGIPPYDVEITVALPDDAHITKVLPTPETIYENSILFTQHFNQDILIEIDFKVSEELNLQMQSTLNISEKNPSSETIRFVPTLPPRQNFPPKGN